MPSDRHATNGNDGIVGFSCGQGSGQGEVDLSAVASATADGAIGTGTEGMFFEQFGSTEFDLSDSVIVLCGTQGDDSDGDGWTDVCGDADDTDPLVHP